MEHHRDSRLHEDEKIEIASAIASSPASSERTDSASSARYPRRPRTIIRPDYTREGRRRNWSGLIGAVCRHVACRCAEGVVERRMRID